MSANGAVTVFRSPSGTSCAATSTATRKNWKGPTNTGPTIIAFAEMDTHNSSVPYATYCRTFLFLVDIWGERVSFETDEEEKKWESRCSLDSFWLSRSRFMCS